MQISNNDNISSLTPQELVAKYLNNLDDEINRTKEKIADYEKTHSHSQTIEMKSLYDSYVMMVSGGSQIKLSDEQTKKIAEYVTYTSNKSLLESLLSEKKDFKQKQAKPANKLSSINDKENIER